MTDFAHDVPLYSKIIFFKVAMSAFDKLSAFVVYVLLWISKFSNTNDTTEDTFEAMNF